MHAMYPCNPEPFFSHYLSHSIKPQKYMSILLSMAVKSFLDQNQLLHLLKHAGHRHSGVQVRFLKCVIIERPFNLLFLFYSGSFHQITLYFFSSVHSNGSEFLAFVFKSTASNELGKSEKKATADQSRKNKETKRYTSAF